MLEEDKVRRTDPLQRIHERAESFIRELERVAGARIRIPGEPQILGVYGAALLAAENDGSRDR